MEPNPTPEPPEKPNGKNAAAWPLIINLSILLLVAAISGGDTDVLAIAIGILVLVNGIAGIILVISGRRMHYALAFFLSGLLLLLIGYGICGLLVQGGMH